ncbi:SufE family protein [Pseudoalteromonas sp. G4]|uniref:SufE family protein n=1 Tax=Pseudoalteromonas sp. G4 TaxID=2992761 RepID=UPI00237EA14B|nr:SufE family protein [Pseudoalteromonas sp. G4]MDE3271351.1 SufE family protein [Pseudoalteromonas sp. G4]
MTEQYLNLKQNFISKNAWQDKYRDIMLLGKQLPKLPNELKIDNAKVHGCESNVWLYIDFDESEERLVVSADSDTRIVKGLIFIICSMVNGLTIDEFKRINIQSEFESLGLIQHLSPSRGNGILAIAQKISDFAIQNS